jgi:hypothetical protein
MDASRRQSLIGRVERLVDDVLRGRTSDAARVPREATRRTWRLLLLLLACAVAYGACMGSFGGEGPPRTWQILYSALKTPLLLLATFAIALPSFVVLNTLLGLRDDLRQALRAIAASQAGLTVVLVSLAPLTLFWYACGPSYRAATLFNAAMFTVAGFAGQYLLRENYRPLAAKNSRHTFMRRLWLAAYAFVGIQMGWVLRPFIGDPKIHVTFFRAEAWDNAYVIVGRMLWQAVVD